MVQGGTQRELDVNPVEVQRYLKGVSYPARKENLLERARSQGAPDKVIQLLTRFPDREYGAPTDVSKAIGELT